ncbi:hypothetical protein JCM10212_006987 [Sporobolomyces blumeae]
MIATTEATLARALTTRLSRVKRSTIRALSRELVPIVLGLRTATLVDSTSLSHDEAIALSRALDDVQVDGPLLVTHEPTSYQTIVINRDLLRSPRRSFFVDVSAKAPAMLDRPPASFATLIDDLALIAPSISFHLIVLAPDVPARSLIPFVGYLLDYPVAYCLSSIGGTEQNCLGNEPLILVEASLTDETELGVDRLRLLSFSYPLRLARSTPDLARDRIVANLRETLAARIARRAHHGLGVEITSREVVLDQVAL